MKYRNLLMTGAAMTALITPFIAQSQTCIVKTSISGSHGEAYTEVFEYDYVDEKPEFPGGGSKLINFINTNRHYPQVAYEEGIEGKVTCAFVVNSDGKISNIQVLRGVEKTLNQEAVRIVAQMPPWLPGKINNVAVPVRVITCIPFRR